jgi:hypothetical protein
MSAAERRLASARNRMRDATLQAEARTKYREVPWEVTSMMRAPVNAGGLDEFGATAAADVVPVRKRVANNTPSYVCQG